MEKKGRIDPSGSSHGTFHFPSSVLPTNLPRSNPLKNSHPVSVSASIYGALSPRDSFLIWRRNFASERKRKGERERERPDPRLRYFPDPSSLATFLIFPFPFLSPLKGTLPLSWLSRENPKLSGRASAFSLFFLRLSKLQKRPCFLLLRSGTANTPFSQFGSCKKIYFRFVFTPIARGKKGVFGALLLTLEAFTTNSFCARFLLVPREGENSHFMHCITTHTLPDIEMSNTFPP